MIVWVAAHAADRFVERVRPGMTRRDARAELTRLLTEFGTRVPTPAWLERYPLDGTCCWVEICDGVVCILQERPEPEPPVCVTVLTRATVSDAVRAERQGRRRRHQGGRKVKRRASDRTAPEVRRRPRARDWSAE